MKTIEEIKAQIIKDNVGIFHENDEALYKRIIDEFMKRGFPLTHENLFDKRFTYVVYDKFDATINSVSHNYINAHSINIITLEEFIERYPVQEREIVGWNFKDIETVINVFLSDIGRYKTNKGCDLDCNSLRERDLKKLGVLEILCEPVYKEQKQITFNAEGKEPILKLCENGEIFVKGKLIESDKEVVNALREFIEKSKII